MTIARAWRLGLVVLAAITALAPLPPELVERAYSTGAYPVLQHALTSLSNVAPFALFDALIASVAAYWFAALVNDLAARESWAVWPLGPLGPLGIDVMPRVAVRTVVAAAALYLAFLATWGLNYRRVPLPAKLQYDSGHVSPESARALALLAVDRVNALYGSARVSTDAARRSGIVVPAPSLADAFARTQLELGASRTAIPGRPKPTLLDWYFRRVAVDGMTDPFFLETLVAGDLLPVEQPFVVAHEWSHLAGYADEGEANFVGWLTCLHGSEADQYSGWLFLYGELYGSLRPADRVEIASRLGDGPRADRRAIAERVRRYFRPRVAYAGWRVYDKYLKANRVEAGTASYADVVRLALGARFDPAWRPLLRADGRGGH